MESYQRLEVELAGWVGCDPLQMVCCSTGSAALHLALEAMQLPGGTRCLLPDFTFIACARAVTMAGLEPRFIDCDKRLCFDFEKLPRGNGVRRVIMPVHVHGRRCEMDRLQIWRENWASSPTAVIEDMAQAHGLKPHPMTDAACWSFNRTKIVHGEEGGAVMFKDVNHATLARSLRSQGNQGHWVHTPRAWNHRMTNAQAELISASLRDFEWNLARRGCIESVYEHNCHFEWRMPLRDVPWLFDVRIKGLSSDKQVQIVEALRAKEIEARCAFRKCSGQAEYIQDANTPNAKLASQEVIALPIEPGVTTAESVRLAFEVIHSIVDS